MCQDGDDRPDDRDQQEQARDMARMESDAIRALRAARQAGINRDDLCVLASLANINPAAWDY
jgi:hypothetical protein